MQQPRYENRIRHLFCLTVNNVLISNVLLYLFLKLKAVKELISISTFNNHLELVINMELCPELLLHCFLLSFYGSCAIN